MISFNCTEVVPSQVLQYHPQYFPFPVETIAFCHFTDEIYCQIVMQCIASTSSEGCDFGYELSLEECEQAAVDYGAQTFLICHLDYMHHLQQFIPMAALSWTSLLETNIIFS